MNRYVKIVLSGGHPPARTCVLDTVVEDKSHDPVLGDGGPAVVLRQVPPEHLLLHRPVGVDGLQDPGTGRLELSRGPGGAWQYEYGRI